SSSVHGENALRRRVIEDGVRIRPRLCGPDGFERCEFEDRDVVGATVAGEAAASFGSDGDSVNALRIGDVADDGVAVGVEDNDMRAMRNIDAAGGAINRHVVPAFIAADGNRLDDAICSGTRLRGSRGRGGESKEKSNREVTFHEVQLLRNSVKPARCTR